MKLLTMTFWFVTVCLLGLLLSSLMLAAGPEPIAPPIPEEEEYVRIWNPAHIKALDDLIHADAIAGKHWKLPPGYLVKDGWIWHELGPATELELGGGRAKERMPKSWAAQHLAGCLEVGPDPRQFNRKSYMVPLDVLELYEQHFAD